MARTTRFVDLPIRLPGSEAPLRHQISEALLDQIRAGRLKPGDSLPSSRALAVQLGVGRGAVVAAYDELIAAGFLDALAGSGTTVAADACQAARAGARSHVPAVGDPSPRLPLVTVPGGPRSALGGEHAPRTQVDGIPPIDLRPGAPDTTLVSRVDWRRAWRAGAAPGVDDFARVRSAHPELQRALARHLRHTRGVLADPDSVLVVPGVGAALPALVAAAGWGGQRVAVEDPGYVDARTALEINGAHARPVPVDDAGLDPALLRPTDRGVYVTPAHQYPLGGRMPVTRRVELVAWARRNAALVAEDDYDGEFRYDVSPLPALHSLEGAAGSVAYIGTASKILAPSLRLAWIVPPPALREPLAREIELRGLTVSPVTTRALAEFIECGAMARHLARASRVYAARRAALVAAMSRHAPAVSLEGVCAGLHVVARLDDGVDDLAVVSALERRGVRTSPLSAYSAESDARGLVIGYAGMPETQAARVAHAIAEVLHPLATADRSAR